jgi:Porin subfamily
MTMRTLLLGAAAGLVTVGAAQAADLPMTKAEPVEYVKVCTEFGEGFFYIPGTDTCLKIAGEVRADYQFDSRDSRFDDVTEFDTEARLKWDARTATEYGTLRSYVQLNFNYEARNSFGDFDNGGPGFGNGVSTVVDKAFIQWGPITAGKAHTFFGLYDADYANTIFAPYYGPQGDANLFAYTAVFGGGFSATLSIEDGRDHRSGLLFDGGDDFVDLDADGVLDPGETLIGVGAAPYGGQSMPDIVANIRLDQDWGKLMLSGAVHEIRYPVSSGAPGTLFNNPDGDDIDADYGWAVALGGAVNLPFLAGSYIALEASYADGAMQYVTGPSESAFSIDVGSDTYGDTEQRSGWAITGEAGFEITPTWKVIAFGSYLDFDSVNPTEFDNLLAEEGGNNWVAGANVTWTAAPGLTIAAEAYYQKQEIDNFSEEELEDLGFDTEEWAGGIRIKRVF